MNHLLYYMDKHHLVIDAWSCDSLNLQNDVFLANFLTELAQRSKATILKKALVMKRKEIPGFTGSVITSTSHITIHTFSTTKEVTVGIYSYKNLDSIYLRDFIIRYLDLPLNSLKVVNMSTFPEEKVECQEPGCSRKARKIWGGRKVCLDHYDYYRDRKSNQYRPYQSE